MVGSKKKQIKQTKSPSQKYIGQTTDPQAYYQQKPAWGFASVDYEMWSFTQEHIKDDIWIEILPTLQAFETQTWKEILVANKKNNHSLDPDTLNKTARDRLANRHIEAQSLISLRLSGKRRLYGYITDRTFNILWYDDDHGDNNTCVCRSKLKHT